MSEPNFSAPVQSLFVFFSIIWSNCFMFLIKKKFKNPETNLPSDHHATTSWRWQKPKSWIVFLHTVDVLRRLFKSLSIITIAPPLTTHVNTVSDLAKNQPYMFLSTSDTTTNTINWFSVLKTPSSSNVATPSRFPPPFAPLQPCEAHLHRTQTTNQLVHFHPLALHHPTTYTFRRNPLTYLIQAYPLIFDVLQHCSTFCTLWVKFF